MESFFGKYKNPLVLMAVLFIQIIALATQVKRPSDPKVPNSPGTRLIRVWTVTALTPIERAFVGTGHFFRNGWHDYIDLHDVRKQNQELQAQIVRLRMEQVRLKDDAEQAQRLQALLGFRERFISQTTAAQVIGTSGSEQSRVIYIDKGSHDGIKVDMAVITQDGIVGKVKDVFPMSAQVLMINDRDSGAGVILEKSRLQGVLRGSSTGELQLEGVMADQTVEPGEQVIASGGDRIYPKGFPVGTISSAAPDHDTGTFLTIKLKPAADLNRLEEVLVVTKMAEQAPDAIAGSDHVRAADILAQRLPTVPKTDQKPAVVGEAAASAEKKNNTDAKKDDTKKEDKKNADDKKKPDATTDLKKTAGETAPVPANTPADGSVTKAKPRKPAAEQAGAGTQKAVPDSTPENPPSDEKKPPESSRPTENPPQ